MNKKENKEFDLSEKEFEITHSGFKIKVCLSKDVKEFIKIMKGFFCKDQCEIIEAIDRLAGDKLK